METQGSRHLIGRIERSATSEHWDILLQFVKEQVQDHVKDSRKSYGITLAVEELLSNIMRDSSISNLKPGPSIIQIACWRNMESGQNRFELQVSDDAAPFDPKLESVPTSLPDTPIENRKIGGLGLFLIKSSVDEATYSYQHGRNTYRLISNLD
ncbi:ATP-binding protein [Synechococcus sp. 1G10]|uniref:ATP-binding protein n=1 Tax=Synechococcus sp. 1G10 TaxID=2025605 RepID=UPI000B99A954|nr:ATP-binding protein [Synechococcus sp. 1G10]